MHDVHTFERTAHLPAVAIVSSTFAQQAIYQSEALGHSDAEKHIVLAEHPISDCSAAQIAAKADVLYADLVRCLTSDKPTSAMRRRRLRSTEPSALCQAGA